MSFAAFVMVLFVQAEVMVSTIEVMRKTRFNLRAGANISGVQQMTLP